MFSKPVRTARRIQVGLIVGLLASPVGVPSAWGLGGKRLRKLIRPVTSRLHLATGLGKQRSEARVRDKVLGGILKDMADPSRSAEATQALAKHLEGIPELLNPAEARGIVDAFRGAARNLVKGLGKDGEVPPKQHVEALKQVTRVWNETLVPQLNEKVGAWQANRQGVSASHDVMGFHGQAGKEVVKPLFSFSAADLAGLETANRRHAGKRPFAKDVAPYEVLSAVDLYLQNSDAAEDSQHHKTTLQNEFATAHRDTTRRAFETRLTELETLVDEGLTSGRMERENHLESVTEHVGKVTAFIAEKDNNKAKAIEQGTVGRKRVQRVAEVFHKAALLHVGKDHLKQLANLHLQLQTANQQADEAALPVRGSDRAVRAFHERIAVAHELAEVDPGHERAPADWVAQAERGYQDYLEVVKDYTSEAGIALNLARAEGQKRAVAVKDVRAALEAMKQAADGDAAKLGSKATKLRVVLEELKKPEAGAEPKSADAVGEHESIVAQLTRRTRKRLSEVGEEVMFAVVDDPRFDHGHVAAVLDAYAELNDQTDFIFDRDERLDRDGRRRSKRRKKRRKKEMLPQERNVLDQLEGVAWRSDSSPEAKPDAELVGWTMRAEKLLALEWMTKPDEARDHLASVVGKAKADGKDSYDRAKFRAYKKTRGLAKKLGTHSWRLLKRINVEQFAKRLKAESASTHEGQGVGLPGRKSDRSTGKVLLRRQQYVALANDVIAPQLQKLFRARKPWKNLARIDKLVGGLRVLVEEKRDVPVDKLAEGATDSPAPKTQVPYGADWLRDSPDGKKGTVEDHLLGVARKAASGGKYELFGETPVDNGSTQSKLMRVAQLYDKARGKSAEQPLTQAMAGLRANAVHTFVTEKIRVVEEAVGGQREGQVDKNKKLRDKARKAIEAAGKAILFGEVAGVERSGSELRITNSFLFEGDQPMSRALAAANDKLGSFSPDSEIAD